MVPSDPSKQLVLRPACTARTWHPQWRGTKPLLPVTDSSSATDQRSSKRRPSIPVETDFSIRPFTRQRRGSPCDSPRSRVNAPGLYLQNHPGSSASPVRSLAPALVGPFMAFSRHDQRDGTRCKAFLPGLFVCLPAATPLQDHRSFGIVVLSLTSDEDVCLCRLPDLLSLPAARTIFNYSTRASDHRSGFATSCQTRCSSKTLGTSNRMNPERLSVNRKRKILSVNIYLYINNLRRVFCDLLVYKTGQN